MKEEKDNKTKENTKELLHYLLCLPLSPLFFLSEFSIWMKTRSPFTENAEILCNSKGDEWVPGR